MFLNIDLSLFYEDILEVVFDAIPLLVLGIGGLIFSNILKKERIKKYNNAVVAKVLKVEEAQDLRNRILIYLEYMYNGRIVTGVYKSFVKYHVGSEVRIILYGDKPGQIISDVPNDVSEEVTAINLRLDQFIYYCGMILLFSAIFGILINLIEITEAPIFTYLFILTLYFLVMFIMYGKKKKYNKELNLLNSNKYELIKSKVVGFKPGYKIFNFKSIQFPMVEFSVDGRTEKRLLKEDVVINSSNEKEYGTIMIFRNRETGRIFSESDLKSKVEIVNKVMIIATIVMIISIVLL